METPQSNVFSTGSVFCVARQLFVVVVVCATRSTILVIVVRVVIAARVAAATLGRLRDAPSPLDSCRG